MKKPARIHPSTPVDPVLEADHLARIRGGFDLSMLTEQAITSLLAPSERRPRSGLVSIPLPDVLAPLPFRFTPMTVLVPLGNLQ